MCSPMPSVNFPEFEDDPCACGHQHHWGVPIGAVVQGGCSECTCLIYEPS
jgi:hypothetical protein